MKWNSKDKVKKKKRGMHFTSFAVMLLNKVQCNQLEVIQSIPTVCNLLSLSIHMFESTEVCWRMLLRIDGYRRDITVQQKSKFGTYLGLNFTVRLIVGTVRKQKGGLFFSRNDT